MTDEEIFKGHGIHLKGCPVRCPNKNGIIERKNRTVKTISGGLKNDRTSSFDTVLLSRETFLTNVFSGSNFMSSFELARGYKAAMLVFHFEIISKDLLEAYKDLVTRRDLHRPTRSRETKTIPLSFLLSDTEVYFSFNTSKQNSPIECRIGIVHQPHPRYLAIRRQISRTKTFGKNPMANLHRNLQKNK